jgi:hypothetical protein
LDYQFRTRWREVFVWSFALDSGNYNSCSLVIWQEVTNDA